MKSLIKLIKEYKYEVEKPWFLSRTLWLNILAMVAMIIQSRYGFVISVEEQVAIITVANIILRIFTDQELTK